MQGTALIGAHIHDGNQLHQDHALVLKDRAVLGIFEKSALPAGVEIVQLDGGTLMPGFVDLQVNGGGGVMFNHDPSPETLFRISKAHAGTGTVAFLPTLITDTATATSAAIDAVEQALELAVPGILGIHLEGPHLSVVRKGAHLSDLIRPMTEEDLEQVLKAADRLPNVMVTIAPENVSVDQTRCMADAGVIVSLGHTDASFEVCCEYIKNGVQNVTHLFNAMSPLNSRAPGLVGAAFDNEKVSAGLISDGVHVHPATMRAALGSRCGKRIFLVTDAMAPLGTDIEEFKLNGRTIFRENGKLTLKDGTLAGADLDMPLAIRTMISDVSVAAEHAIKMATSIPARTLRTNMGFGKIKSGSTAGIIHLDPQYQFSRII